MPLDVDNGLPGIEPWLGKYAYIKIDFTYHMYTYTDMNTVNLKADQWLTTTQLQLVAKYIQSDDSCLFEPLRLSYTIEDLEKI